MPSRALTTLVSPASDGLWLSRALSVLLPRRWQGKHSRLRILPSTVCVIVNCLHAQFVRLVDTRYYHEFGASFLWRDHEVREATIPDLHKVQCLARTLASVRCTWSNANRLKVLAWCSACIRLRRARRMRVARTRTTTTTRSTFQLTWCTLRCKQARRRPRRSHCQGIRVQCASDRVKLEQSIAALKCAMSCHRQRHLVLCMRLSNRLTNQPARFILYRHILLRQSGWYLLLEMASLSLDT